MSKTKTIKKRKGINWEKKILDYLKEHPSGLTITDIANGVEPDTSWVTVTKYIRILLEQKKVFLRKIGGYNLYFSTERFVIPSQLVRSFYKGILIGLKENLTSIGDFKKLGYIIADNMKIQLLEQFPKSLKPQIKSFEDFIQYFGKIYPYLDIISEKHVTIEEEISEDGTEALYYLKNVNLLDLSEDFRNHYYVLSGVLERTISRIFKKDIQCNILSINLDEKSVKLSMKLKEWEWINSNK